jgi:hypothetical protein
MIVKKPVNRIPSFRGGIGSEGIQVTTERWRDRTFGHCIQWFTGFITCLLLGYWFRGKRMQAPAITNPIFAARVLPPGGYLSRQHDPQDAARADFLLYLATARPPITAWEAQFLRGTLGRAWFTEKQKAVIDRLRLKYQSQL